MAFLGLLLVVACRGPLAVSGAQGDRRAVVWDYEVRAVGAPVQHLEVEARLAPGSADRLEADDEAAAFVRDVQVKVGEEWRLVARTEGTWTVPCKLAGCRVRYRFSLRDAALALDDGETALASGDEVVAPPSTWLLRPQAPQGQAGRFRFRVETEPGVRFAAATHASIASPGAFEAETDDLDGASFAVFGAIRTAVVDRGGAHVAIAIAPHALALSDTDVATWVGRAVDAIAGYDGRFPVERTLVVVLAGRPGSPTRGVTLGDGGPGVLVRAPAPATETLLLDAVRDDWVMTHELLHVTLPSLGRQHVWLSEGLPSYIEPFARARAGQLAPEKLWRDLLDGLRQGLPEAGDQGLEQTHTWGRTYWGGALYCLLADVTIRENTAGARSLDDVVRAVVATGADVEVRWDVERLLDVGDRATGTTVLHDLYQSLALRPTTVDLPALWARLGVREAGSAVAFDDGAPLAAIRREMTAPPRRRH